MLPKVSIVVTVFNLESYIDQCIVSLIDQTYRNIEILIVDDGSTDNSVYICDNWCTRDSRIKVYRNNHEGVSVARNTGIIQSTGEWISMFQPYYLLHNHHHPRMISKMDANDIIIGSYYSVKRNGRTRYSFFHDEKWWDLKSDEDSKELVKCAILGGEGITNVGVPWCKLYRKSYLVNNNIKFVNGLSRMQDTVFNVSAFMSGGKVYYIDKPLYNYRIREGSVTTSYKPNFHCVAHQVINCLSQRINMYDDDVFCKDVIFSKSVALLSEIIKLELLPLNLSIKEVIYNIRKNALELGIYDYNVYDHKNNYLNRNKKIKIFLLLHRLEFILYIVMKMNDKLKRVGQFK